MSIIIQFFKKLLSAVLDRLRHSVSNLFFNVPPLNMKRPLYNPGHLRKASNVEDRAQTQSTQKVVWRKQGLFREMTSSNKGLTIVSQRHGKLLHT